MSILFAVICGVIQGAAEFLPVSSSGHLALFQQIFMKDPASADLLAFNVLLHLGTLFAVLIIYRRDIFPLVPAFFSVCGKLAGGGLRSAELSPRERLAVMAFLGTLPMVAAKLVDDRVEALSSSVTAVGVILLVNSAVLFFAGRIPEGRRNGGSAHPATALICGTAQCFAVLPGLSRSGSSIAAGLACGYEREFAVKYSFILSVPAIAGAAVFEIPDAFKHGIPSADLPACAADAVTALICGAAAVKLLAYISRKKGFGPFAVYCLAVGAAAVTIGVFGIRMPVF